MRKTRRSLGYKFSCQALNRNEGSHFHTVPMRFIQAGSQSRRDRFGFRSRPATRIRSVFPFHIHLLNPKYPLVAGVHMRNEAAAVAWVLIGAIAILASACSSVPS